MRRVIGWLRMLANTPLVRSLRFRLIGLVLLASLPSTGLLFLTAAQTRDDAISNAQAEANRIATLTSSEQAREMDRVQRELNLLSRLPEVRGDDTSLCTSFFQALVADSENAMYVDLRVITTDGRVICRSSASNPLGQNEDRRFIEEAIGTEQFTVGDYRINPLNGRSIISFAAPVANEDNEIDRAVVATLDLGSQMSALSRTTLPPGTVLSVIDSNGRLLLQQPVQDNLRIGASLMGTPVVDVSLDHTLDPEAVTQGGIVLTSSEGYVSASSRIQISGYQPSQDGAWIIVQTPTEEVLRRSEQVFRDNLAKLAVAISIAVVAAWIGADLFVARDAETRKSIVAELYHSYSSGVVEHLDTIVSEDFVDAAPMKGQVEGLSGLKQTIAAFRHAFPDGEVVPREMLADNDKVAVRVSLTGTQVSDFQGLPATGKRMIADGMETWTFRDGVIVEGTSLMGPLLEMKMVEKPVGNVEPPQAAPRKGWLGRVRDRFRLRRRRNDSAG